MWVTKILIFPVEIRIFAPKRPNLAKIGIFGRFGPGHAGFFGALLVGQLVVVVRGLYLARHLFTLYVIYFQYPGKEYSPRTTATNQPTFSLIHFSGCGHNMFRVQNGPFFGPKVWVVGYKLQPY